MLPAEKIASKFRNENEIHRGNRIVLVRNDGSEEKVKALKNVSVKHFGKNSLIKIQENYNIVCANFCLGEGAYIEIGKNFSVRFNLNIDTKTNNGTIIIGSNVNIGECHIVAGDEDGLEVIIGNNFLAATDVFIRNSDSHSIFDIESNALINIPKFGVHIGDNVWCGYNATILKDANIPDNCVIGACSVVGHKEFVEHSIIAGVPARIIRTGITWDSRTVTKIKQLEEKETDKKYFEDNFFVITSDDNLNEIIPRLYGYAVLEDKLLINSHNCNRRFSGTDFGVYVNVTTDDNEINIYQDYFGSFGLHLYRNREYWAISNSFIYLVNYLSKKKSMSFDDDFAKAFLAPPTAVLSYENTMIKEITILPRNCTVKINKSERKLDICSFEQKETYIPIDSKEAIAIIDTWHNKWNRIIKTLSDAGEFVTCDLSGGKDSRASFTSLFAENLDLNSIHFNSTNDKLYTHGDDYAIACKIAEKYGFHLNAASDKRDTYKMNPEQNLNASLLLKCGFHKELMFTTLYNRKTMFKITGSGGEALRDHWSEPVDDFISNNCKYVNFNSVDSAGCLNEMLTVTVEKQNKAAATSCTVANDYFYKNVRMRYHFGKGQAEMFMSNSIWLAPLLDPSLYTLNQNIGKDNDSDLLYAVLYDRFIPEINDLPFDSNRIVDEKTWKLAREINEKYPYIKAEATDEIKLTIDSERIAPLASDIEKTPFDCLKELFYSDEVSDFIRGYFGKEVYNKADLYYRNTEYHPYIQAAGLVETYLVYKLANNGRMPSAQSEDFFVPSVYSNNGFMREIIDLLNSARVDIKDTGAETNNIEIISCSDKDYYMEIPHWWIDAGGKGKVVQSSKGEFEIKFRCIGDGKLNLRVMGPHMKDNDENILSIKTDIMLFTLSRSEGGEQIISEKKAFTVDSRRTRKYETPCADGEVFDLKIKWYPYVYAPDELNTLFSKLYYRHISQFKFWKPNR